MQAHANPRLVAAIVLTLLVGGHPPCRATPLSDDAPARGSADAGYVRRFSDIEILGGASVRPEDETPGTTTPADAVQRYTEGVPGSGGTPWAHDRASAFQYGPNSGGPLEILRSLANGPKGSPRNAAQRQSNTPDIDLLGPDAREWIDDTVRGIVSSAIETRTNDQGRTTVSILGMGDFGVMGSADRSQAPLGSEDAVLLTAGRTPYGAVPAGGMTWSPEGHRLPAGGMPSAAGATTIQKAVELVQEVATHPLSMLVYGILAAFAVLWKVMSSQASRRTARAPFHHHAEPVPVPQRSRRRRHHTSRRTRSRH